MSYSFFKIHISFSYNGVQKISRNFPSVSLTTICGDLEVSSFPRRSSKVHITYFDVSGFRLKDCAAFGFIYHILLHVIIYYPSPPLFFVFPQGTIMKIGSFLTCIMPSLPQYLSYIITCCIKSTFVLCISPRDHNENKVFLDLYYAIPATVYL